MIDAPPAPPREAPDRVLSTLNRDGTRRWLDPRLSPGRFLTRRRAVAALLLALYNLLPWLEINGRPAILLDVAHREFTFFGATFLPTDTLLLMLFVAGVFVLIFLLTALLGRVWCGWACPQTVYMEFVFRPLERMFLGATPAARKANARTMPFRRAVMYAAYALIAFHLANTFLSYFVGAHTVFNWTLGSPFNHPAAFLLVLAVTGLMLFDFAFFREQVCIVACPYGRFQSVMLDRSSLIIGYDRARGEPRGKRRIDARGSSTERNSERPLPVLGLQSPSPSTRGDCIDCRMCVNTCPTGIDIRDGLQMECIGCAQCIDACDTVMDKIARPRGLIRYSSQEAMTSGRRVRLRPRLILYPALLLVIASAFVAVLATRAPADVTLVRATARPYVVLNDGRVVNEVTVKVVNRTDTGRRYTFGAADDDEATVAAVPPTLDLAPGETGRAVLSVTLPRAAFALGRAQVVIVVRDDAGFDRRLRHRVQGPLGGGPITNEEGSRP
jgi:cytochrome c oxidase accessory protein FixG